jgi:hypothetical protein
MEHDLLGELFNGDISRPDNTGDDSFVGMCLMWDISGPDNTGDESFVI